MAASHPSGEPKRHRGKRKPRERHPTEGGDVSFVALFGWIIAAVPFVYAFLFFMKAIMH